MNGWQIASIIIGALGLGGFMTAIWTGLYNKRKKKIDHLVELQKKEEEANLIEAIRKVVKEELAPYQSCVSEFRQDIGLLKLSNQSLCKSALQEMYKQAEKTGYSSDDDKERWSALYKSYHSLGKNGVMDVKNEQYLSLPNSKPRVNKSTKTQLKQA